MKTSKYILVMTVGLLLPGLFSCDDNDKPVAPKPDGEALSAFVEDNIDERSQSFTLDAAAGGQIKGDQGTTIKFGTNAFLTLAGAPVVGTVDIELIEIYNRSSMLLTHRPTVGRNDD